MLADEANILWLPSRNPTWKANWSTESRFQSSALAFSERRRISLSQRVWALISPQSTGKRFDLISIYVLWTFHVFFSLIMWMNVQRVSAWRGTRNEMTEFERITCLKGFPTCWSAVPHMERRASSAAAFKSLPKKLVVFVHVRLSPSTAFLSENTMLEWSNEIFIIRRWERQKKAFYIQINDTRMEKMMRKKLVLLNQISRCR